MSKRQSISKSELARELAVSPALITKWLDSGLLRERRDGLLDRGETFDQLRLYWVPAAAWHARPLPPDSMGAQLRRAWAREAEESGTADELRALLEELNREA